MPTPSLNSAALRQLEEKGFTAGMIQALPDSSVVHYNKIYQEQTGSYDTPPPTAPAANQRATVAERLALVGTGAAEQAFIASEFGDGSAPSIPTEVDDRATITITNVTSSRIAVLERTNATTLQLGTSTVSYTHLTLPTKRIV